MSYYMEISGTKRIWGLDADQKKEIEETLRLPNPKYKAAVAYSKWGPYVKIPQYLYYSRKGQSDRGPYLEVPLGVKVNLQDMEVVDLREEKTLKDFPNFQFKLRPLQEEAFAAWVKNTDKGIICCPTGTGKSILGLYLAARTRQKTLIIVHKTDLVLGWKKDIQQVFGDKAGKIGIIQASKRQIGDYFTIASIATISRSGFDIASIKNEFGMIIEDECLVGETLVLLEDGGVIPIRDVQNGTRLSTGVANNCFSRKTLIHRLYLGNGFIDGSSTHPVWCIDKRKNFNDRKNQYTFENAELEKKCLVDLRNTRDYLVPVLIKVPHTEKVYVSDAEAAFVASILCCGHLDNLPSKRVKTNVSKDKEFYTKCYEDMSNEGIAPYKYSFDCRGNLTLWTRNRDFKVYLMKRWGIPDGKKSSDIRIPEFFYYAPLSAIKAFVETCFSCEGDLSMQYPSGHRINFNTCSKDFALGLSYLMRKFGVLPTLTLVKRDKPGHSDSYRLGCGGVMFNRFMQIFNGVIARKHTNAMNSATQYRNRFWGEYYLSDVVDVREMGYVDRVYDFTVPETASFVANGVFTHNCHHCPSESFRLLNDISVPYKVGLSATPERNDGLTQVLKYYFGGFAYTATHDMENAAVLPVDVRLISDTQPLEPHYFQFRGEWISEYHFFCNGWDYLGFPVEKEKDMIPLSKINRDDRPTIRLEHIEGQLFFANQTLAGKMFMDKIYTTLTKHLDHNHSCVLFAKQKNYIKILYEYLVKRGVSENIIQTFYGDSKEKDEEIIARAESKEKLVTIATYAKASEGTNVKAWEVGFALTSVGNGMGVEQVVGRVRRAKEGKLSPVIWYDFCHQANPTLYRHLLARLKRYKKMGCKIFKESLQ